MITFRLKMKRTKHFFTVTVFDTKKEMLNDYVTKYDEHIKFEACVKPCFFQCESSLEIGKDIGSVYFYRGNLKAGLLAHEMLHCALWYDRIVNLNHRNTYIELDSEEQLAYVLMELTDKVVTLLDKYDAFPDSNGDHNEQ